MRNDRCQPPPEDARTASEGRGRSGGPPGLASRPWIPQALRRESRKPSGTTRPEQDLEENTTSWASEKSIISASGILGDRTGSSGDTDCTLRELQLEAGMRPRPPPPRVPAPARRPGAQLPRKPAAVPGRSAGRGRGRSAGGPTSTSHLVA